MARSTQEIYDSIIAQKEADSNLDGLTSTSQTAIWRLWAYITAAAINIHEQLWDVMKGELEELAEQAIVNTPKWFVGRVLDYQDGDPLLISDDYKPYYETIDESKRIVKYAAAVNVGGVGVVKVAKDNGSGTPVPLSTQELNRLKGYINDIQPPGVAIAVESRSSDKLRITGSLFYDANLDVSIVQANVLAAIKAYLGNLGFNGRVHITKLVDAIQAVDGITDVQLTTVQGEESGATPTTFSRVYTTRAGHIQLDESNSNLTYLAE